MRRQHIDIRTTTLAGPAAVYALLADGASWPDWSPMDSYELEQEGEGGPEGVGAVRVFRNGRIEGHDTIVELVADRRLGLHPRLRPADQGLGASVDLEPDGTGTRIRWQASFTATVPPKTLRGIATAIGRGAGTRVPGEIEPQIPKIRQGSCFSSFLQPRKRSEQALVSVVLAAGVEASIRTGREALLDARRRPPD